MAVNKVKAEQAQLKFTSGTANLLKELDRRMNDAVKSGVETDYLTNILTDKVTLVRSMVKGIEAGIPFPLLGNRSAIFDLVEIPFEEIEKRTVPHEVNAREVMALTEESLSDIIPLLSEQGNTSPAFANLDPETSMLHIVDGLRRRMACHYKKVPFRVYVAREPITIEDAAFLDKVGQANKPLSYRELGLARLVEWERVDNEGNRVYTDKTALAEALFGSDFTASNYEMLLNQLRFATIPQVILALIPNYNSLTVQLYKRIYKIDAQLNTYAQEQQRKLDEVRQEFVDLCTHDVKLIKASSADEIKLPRELIDLLSVKLKEFLSVEFVETPKYLPIFEFVNKKKKVLKREAGDITTFKLSYLGKKDVAKVEEAILEVLSTMKGAKS